MVDYEFRSLEMNQTYDELNRLDRIIDASGARLKTAQETRAALIEEMRRHIAAGNLSDNPRRDLVFALFGPGNDYVQRRLVELDGQIANYSGQLALVVEEDSKPLTPNHGVVFDDHSCPPAPWRHEKLRVLKLGVLNGEQLIVDCQKKTCALLVARFIERRSTVRFGVNGLESQVLPIVLIDRPCLFELRPVPEISKMDNITLICEGSPAMPIPLILIGTTAVTKWMEEHRLHFDTGACPSPFIGLCEQLGFQLSAVHTAVPN